jgi:hypothetical protein
VYRKKEVSASFCVENANNEHDMLACESSSKGWKNRSGSGCVKGEARVFAPNPAAENINKPKSSARLLPPSLVAFILCVNSLPTPLPYFHHYTHKRRRNSPLQHPSSLRQMGKPFRKLMLRKFSEKKKNAARSGEREGK